MSITPTTENRFRTFTTWEGYMKYLDVVDRHVRVTYDRGRLELLTTSYEHERMKTLISGLLECLLEEWFDDYEGGGTTTFPRKDLDRGLEPDECYWIRTAHRMINTRRWEYPRDPAPELVLEIDITSSSLDRLDIYRTMQIHEVWHFSVDDGFRVLVLQDDGVYRPSDSSPTFPSVPLSEVSRHIEMGRTKTAGHVRASFRRWLRRHVQSLQTKRSKRRSQPPASD